MLWKYLWKQKLQILCYVVMVIIGAVGLAIFTLWIAKLFDAAEIGNVDLVLTVIAVMFAGYLAMRIVNYLADLLSLRIINKVRQDLKDDLFAGVLNKQISEIVDRNSGEYIAEFTNDITLIEANFLIPCKELFGYLVTIISTCVAITTIHPLMALILGLGVLICTLFPLLTTKYVSSLMVLFTDAFSNHVQLLKDHFSIFFTIKNYNIEKQIIDRFTSSNTRTESVKFNAEFALVLLNNLVGRLAWLVELLVFMIGLVFVLSGRLNIGSVFAAYLLAGEIGIPLQGVAKRVSMIRSVRGIEKKFIKMKGAGQLKGEEVKTATPERHSIVFQNVSLDFDGNRVLNNINYTFEVGKKYLIVGQNGYGKSTLAKLLKGLYPNYTGTISIGSDELRSEHGDQESRSISYLNETVSVLSDTVANNILLYREVDEKAFKTALQLAHFDLPLDRRVGDNGRNLSSGEIRKLEIARALISNPSVLIMDEIISTLDIETAYEIEKITLELNGQTVISISNAFSGKLLGYYNNILVMQDGNLVAHGTHAELIDNCPIYKQMYEIRCGGDRIEK